MTSFLDYWRIPVVQRKLISFNLEVSIWDCLEAFEASKVLEIFILAGS
jgi:hypothetical protein